MYGEQSTSVTQEKRNSSLNPFKTLDNVIDPFHPPTV